LLISKELNKSLTKEGASEVIVKEYKSLMSVSLIERFEQHLEQRLRTQVLRAEEEVDQAIPDKQEEALQHYEEALSRFGRLVVSRRLTRESRKKIPTLAL
jgi:hypothetical protein